MKTILMDPLQDESQNTVTNYSETEEDTEEYLVEKVLRKRIYKGKIQYFLKWKGYDDENNTWEPIENLNCKELIQEFEDNAKKQEIMKQQKKEAEKCSRRRTLSTFTKAGPSEGKKVKVTLKEKNKDKAAKKFEEAEKRETEEAFGDKSKSSAGEEKILEKIIAARRLNDNIEFLLKWEGIEEPEIISAKVVNKMYPQEVIQFYYERIKWQDPPAV